MTGTITDDQARALASLVAALRPGWDVAGVRSALHVARHRAPAHELAIAAIRCTQGDARTPAVIGMDGPHWAALPVAETRAARPPRCQEHQRDHVGGVCPSCRAEQIGTDTGAADPPTWGPDQAQTNAQGAALVRAALLQIEAEASTRMDHDDQGTRALDTTEEDR